MVANYNLRCEAPCRPALYGTGRRLPRQRARGAGTPLRLTSSAVFQKSKLTDLRRIQPQLRIPRPPFHRSIHRQYR